MKETFAGKIRQAIKELSATKSAMTARDISVHAALSWTEDRKLRLVINDFCKTGELVRVQRGLYQYRGKRSGKPNIQERMWRVLRTSRSRVVEINDLTQMAGAGEEYAKEWLQMLVHQGIVRKLNNGKWQMTHDPVAMPLNEEKAEKLREIRRKKKEQALEALERARTAIENICI